MKYYKINFKNFLKLSLFFLFFIIGLNIIRAETNTKYLIDQTKDNIYKNNYEEALNKINQVIQSSPSESEALALRCFIRINLQDMEALDDCNTALKRNPKSELAYIAKGYFHMSYSNPQEADFNYKKAIEINPNSDIAYYYLASNNSQFSHLKKRN